jgi:hypothetical protein
LSNTRSTVATFSGACAEKNATRRSLKDDDILDAGCRRCRSAAEC